MKAIFLTAFSICGAAHAQSTAPYWICMPTLPIIVVTAPYGSAYAWWCKSTDAQGANVYRLKPAAIHKDDYDPVKFSAASARVVSAADPLAQVSVELSTFQAPPVGSLKDYQYRMLSWSACEKARTAPPESVTLPANWCGDQPIAPAGPAYVVANAAANANPAGTRPTYKLTLPSTIAVDGGRITQGAVCDCSAAKATIGSSVYCSVLSDPAKVALCTPKP